MVPTPTPTPTPLLVQIVSDNQIAWWWSGLLTGGAVLVAALIAGAIAFFSLRASDKRKLRREDLRQWDALLKDAYVSTSTGIDELGQIYEAYPGLTTQSEIDEAVARSNAIVRRLYGHANEFTRVTSKSTTEAMRDVASAALNLVTEMSLSVRDPSSEESLIAAEFILLTELQKAIRIAK